MSVVNVVGFPSATGVVSFACSACGKCCNSPPLMTMPELFRHQDLFVGALGIRALPRGEIQLVTLGLGFPSLAACPARLQDGRCGIHDLGKPAMCRTVPLDPFVADAAQHRVLVERSTGSGYLGADCIVVGDRDGMERLVADGAVVDAEYREQLHAHRRSLSDDEAMWGAAVKQAIAAEWHPGRARAGLTTLPLVPVLATLAAVSDACRERCLHYVRRQVDLIRHCIDAALVRKQPQDRALTAELRSYVAAYDRLAASLAHGELGPQRHEPFATQAERFLGVDVRVVARRPEAHC